MDKWNFIQDKVVSLEVLLKKIATWRLKGDKIVFTNGCFDLLHRGHVQLLAQSAQFGNKLILGLNSDASVKGLKGAGRPINDEKSRALVLASLLYVDAVVVFEEDTPLDLIKFIHPDVLVKGGDYDLNTIVGAKEVQEYGGEVMIIPLVNGKSTTQLIEKIKE